MRTLRPDCAAALNTASLKFSLLTTWEQENVNKIPPGLIFSKAFALSFLYPWRALFSTFLCFAITFFYRR